MSSSSTTNSDHQWPIKTSELQNHHMDSTRWNNFPFRPDDIVIATWAKSGTTWMQQIVSQLIFHGAEVTTSIHEASPWVEARFIPEGATVSALEAQTHRRFMKTHLPLENLVYSPSAEYIFVGRDGRDAIWSAHNHLYHATPWFYDAINNMPGRVGPPITKPGADPRQFYLDFLDNDEQALWPFWTHIRGWFGAKDLPNLLLVHFNDLKADLEGEIRRIAEFLDIEVPEDKLALIIRHCGFEYMKTHAEAVSPPGAAVAFDEGAKTFINKGSNGRWKDVLSEKDVELYEAKVRSELSPECASWLAHGKKALEK
ncbi:hypothetical protein MBLNU457_4704t1 [Dothideomycetes sp. NU457]